MLLEFVYTNWKGIDHTYVIEPERIEFVSGEGSEQHVDNHWCMHGLVVARSGDPRPEMGSNRRRTFVIVEMRHIREVERSV